MQSAALSKPSRRTRRVSAFHDISEGNDLIEQAPIAWKADAFAALDLIREETIQPGHHLVISMIAALRRFIEKT